ncbi:adenylate/guanylate cyclase domain-containing protein [Fontimonas sp. SYSU GA230001]|uniref:adenylate/guanylate cyclase domain-containing protein n=1 Tax=Fontimonas sp. SYSU GA230001 TaxID=3142450 RepID=UPI0032B35895
MNGDSLICATCGTANPAGARFCNQCGSRITAAEVADYTPRHLRGALAQGPAVQGERKRVTVLFADIKGSTRLAEQAGAELWHEVLDRFFAILSRVVHRYDGTINQYTGDGIMALFGAPRALEDHAQFAARAALEMQHEVRRYADELRLSHGLNLTMRVGLNSGEVVVGRIGDDLRSDYTAQGPTVNLAARMEHICEPGRVYVSRDTANLLRGYFRLRALGATEVHGIDAPVEVFELEGAEGLRTRLDRSLARAGSPFIGRERELAALAAALDRVRGGCGQIVAVIGNAGLGKSRLCHEFAEACARDGVAVHRATGVPYASRVPMFPIRQLLRSKLGVPESASPQEARRWIAGALLLEDPGNAAVLPHVFDFLDIAEAGARAQDSGAAAAQHMLDQLARYLPCTTDPQILLVEDLHFFDRASETFLVRLCERVRQAPCLLLLNFRPDYVSEGLQPLIDESIALSALDDAQLQHLAGTLLGGDPSVAEVARTVARRAGGNPYFVEEAVLALADGGWLQGRPRAWRLTRPVEEWPLPDSVQALLAARIDRLPDTLRGRLHTASVIGQVFDAELLARLDGVADVEEDIAALEELGFVHHRDGGGIAFCHPLVQEVAYRGQLEARRRSVHARLAALLEARHRGAGAGPQELALRIAHHWQCAAEWDRAGQWNLLAVRWALGHSIVVVAEQVRRALANFDRAPDSAEVIRGRIAARASLIRIAQFVATADADVERAYQEARAMAAASNDVAGHAEVLISYGNELLHRGQVDAAANMHDEAIALCFERGQTELINRFRLAMMLSFNAAGRLRRIIDVLDAAGGDWRLRSVDEENFQSRGFYGLMLGWMGRLDEAARHLDAALAFAERAGRAASWMYTNQVDLAFLTGAVGPVLAAAEKGLTEAEKYGSPFFRAIALRGYGLALSLNGRHDEALTALEEAAPLVVRGAAAHQFEANQLATHALALLRAGRAAEAERRAQAARDSAARAGSRIWEIIAWLVWLQLPAVAQRREEAQAGIRRVGHLIEFTGAEGFRPWVHAARAHWASDPHARALALADAQAGFAAIGAQAYAQAMAERRDRDAATMRESA